MGLPDEVIQIVCNMRRQALAEADHEDLKAVGIVSLKHRMKVRDQWRLDFLRSSLEFKVSQ